MKFERKRLYRCEDVLLSVTCNFYSDKIVTPQARFCWTLSGEVAGGAGGAIAPPAGLKKGAPK